MHAPPAVSYPAGRNRFAAGLCLVLWLAGLAVTFTWLWTTPAPGWRQATGLAAVVACGLAALLFWHRMPAGLLAWDGAHWSWAAGAHPRVGHPEVALDLQSVLLLR